MREAIKNATAELLRVVLLAVVPVLIVAVEDGQVDWRIVGTVAFLAALRFVDKLLHKWGESKGNRTLMGGLTRF